MEKSDVSFALSVGAGSLDVRAFAVEMSMAPFTVEFVPAYVMWKQGMETLG